ncbi:Retrotransposon Gag-like protein 6 [Anabarilius grahami]|uniref:Retrotransposon Gag-like protein 6 n=1 Tax=Anabarilius grahami TaxID=495550 RepID=A0A3N0Y6H2_ANAGA|nr:Retrotransposon Gag-like protein 6 [Anabarilius grahami]
MSTPDPFQDLVDPLHRTLTSPFTPTTPATTSALPAASPSPPAIASPMAKPAPFSGSAEDCNGFLLQCSLVLEMQPHLYPDDKSKVAFIISQLDGKALRWAEPLWSQDNPVVQSLSSFTAHFKEVFGKPTWDSSIYSISKSDLIVISMQIHLGDQTKGKAFRPTLPLCHWLFHLKEVCRLICHKKRNTGILRGVLPIALNLPSPTPARLSRTSRRPRCHRAHPSGVGTTIFQRSFQTFKPSVQTSRGTEEANELHQR